MTTDRLHRWNKTYTYVTAGQRPRSATDDTPLITKIQVQVDAVDLEDSNEVFGVILDRSIDYYYLTNGDLPESFIPVAEITNQQMIDWFMAGTSDEDIDAWLTYQHYGWDPIPEPVAEEGGE